MGVAHESTFSGTEVPQDVVAEPIRLRELVGSPEDRQIADAFSDHHPGVPIPGSVDELIIMRWAGQIVVAAENMLSVDQEVTQDDDSRHLTGPQSCNEARTDHHAMARRTGNRGEGSRCRFSNQLQVTLLIACVVRVGTPSM